MFKYLNFSHYKLLLLLKENCNANTSLIHISRVIRSWQGEMRHDCLDLGDINCGLDSPVVRKFIELDNAICDLYASQLEKQETLLDSQKNELSQRHILA